MAYKLYANIIIESLIMSTSSVNNKNLEEMGIYPRAVGDLSTRLPIGWALSNDTLMIKKLCCDWKMIHI